MLRQMWHGAQQIWHMNLTNIFEKLLRQLLNMLHHFMRISCLLSNALHLIGYELQWKEKREKDQRAWNRQREDILLKFHLYPSYNHDLHHQTGLWLGTEDPAQTRTQRRPCRPAPSSGSHPQLVISAPKMQPGEKTTSFIVLFMLLYYHIFCVKLNFGALRYLMEANDGFRVDANYMQTPSIALKELREQPQEDGADLFILQRTWNNSALVKQSLPAMSRPSQQF